VTTEDDDEKDNQQVNIKLLEFPPKERLPVSKDITAPKDLLELTPSIALYME